MSDTPHQDAQIAWARSLQLIMRLSDQGATARLQIGRDIATRMYIDTGEEINGAMIYGVPVDVVPERGIVRMVEEAE